MLKIVPGYGQVPTLSTNIPETLTNMIVTTFSINEVFQKYSEYLNPLKYPISSGIPDEAAFGALYEINTT